MLRSALRRPAPRALLPLLLVLLIGCAFNREGAFFLWQTHRGVLREISGVGMLACGMTLVVVSGGIDLSVGSLLGLSAVGFSLLVLPLGWPALPALALVVVAGALSGLSSGLLITRMKMQPFIATLAMMVFARGLAKRLSGGRKVSTYVPEPDGSFRELPLPEIFSILDDRVLFDQVSVVTVLFAGCVALTAVVLGRMRLGRYLYAIGGNLQAARLSGVPVRQSLCLAYALSGAFAAIAGICQAAQETQGDPETGLGYELDAIAMVVLGGTRLSGGRGGVLLTLIGALTLGYLQKVLSLNAFSTETRLMLTGVILVLAIGLQRGR